MLATSSCWYAGFSSELLLAVRNYRTYMLYLGEQARHLDHLFLIQSYKSSPIIKNHPFG